MVGNRGTKNTRDIAIIALLTALLFVQEQLLFALPGVQLTIFLIVLFSKKLGLIKTVIMVVIHVILDNLFVGSFSLMYTPTMFVGLLIIPFYPPSFWQHLSNYKNMFLFQQDWCL